LHDATKMVQIAKVRVNSESSEQRTSNYTGLFTNLLKSVTDGTLRMEKLCESLWRFFDLRRVSSVRYNPFNSHSDRHSRGTTQRTCRRK
jgi:hypothetical protein